MDLLKRRRTALCTVILFTLCSGITSRADDTKTVLELTQLGAQLQLGDGGSLIGVTLQGDRITDEQLKLLAPLRRLQLLTLQNTKITGAGLSHLAAIDSLETLSIRYSPIADRHVEHLAALKNVNHYHLYGTRMSDMGKQRLEVMLRKAGRDARIDFHGGGFLGVSCSQTEENCVVLEVVANSSAAEAGLQAGDVIVKFAGKDVPNFAALVELVSESAVGDTVKLSVRRDGEIVTYDLKLSSREVPFE